MIAKEKCDQYVKKCKHISSFELNINEVERIKTPEDNSFANSESKNDHSLLFPVWQIKLAGGSTLWGVKTSKDGKSFNRMFAFKNLVEFLSEKKSCCYYNSKNIETTTEFNKLCSYEEFIDVCFMLTYACLTYEKETGVKQRWFNSKDIDYDYYPIVKEGGWFDYKFADIKTTDEYEKLLNSV